MSEGLLPWLPEPALQHPDLLAAPTLSTLRAWSAADERVADAVRVVRIDPRLADTAALVAAYDLDLDRSVNCVVVVGRRDGTERLAGVCVRASTRADVNYAVKRLLDVRKATFLPMERAVEETGMEYGGITPVGLPSSWRLLLDTGAVASPADVVIGSGVRHSKLVLPGDLLAALPGVQVAPLARA